ncbi:MAG: TIGR01459 family HAD-type hydrolase [Hyphomicrobiales bacterium]
MLHRDKNIPLCTARDLAGRYDGWLCDVWGVVHNGVRAYDGAVEALTRFREGGGRVVLITNAPRPAASVVPQLRQLGVPGEAYDAVVTSGDVTHELVRENTATRLFHLGPERDLPLLKGLESQLVPFDEANAVLLTGALDDENETAEDYRPFLEDVLARKLALYCANPDLVVQRGDRLLICAGAIAKLYSEIGGEVHIAGKPHAPIYDAAREHLAELAEHKIAHDRLLAIGDGLPTDVKGAHMQNLDVLFLTGGIFAGEMDGPLNENRADALASKLRAQFPGLRLAGINDELRWA